MKLSASLGILLLVTSLGCGIGEAHFQGVWKLDIGRASSAIQRYRASHGSLPDRLEETYDGHFPSESERLVQYRKESPTQYLLWVHREDIERFGDRPQIAEPTRAEPKAGDVFCRYDVEGRALVASWEHREATP